MKKIVVISLLGSLFLFSCKKEEIKEQEQEINQILPTTNFLASIGGNSFNMEFTTSQSGAPYTLGQQVNFTFASDGAMSIDENPTANDGDEVTVSSYTESGNEWIWSDINNGHIYKLSLTNDSSINEVNVFNVGNTFLGQFTPIDTSSGTNNIVSSYAGNYTVTSVDQGSHTRMTVSIDVNGNIDFDAGVILSASNFALISDRLTCCGGIWIDMDPYPTENYPRVNLFIDQTTNQLNKIEYLPENPTINNRVTINLSL